MNKHNQPEQNTTLLAVGQWAFCALLALSGVWLLFSGIGPAALPVWVEQGVLALQVALLLLLFRFLPGERGFEWKLLAQNALWLIAARVLLGCLRWDNALCCALLMLAAFTSYPLLQRDQRRLLLDVLTVAVCGVLSLWSVFGLAAAFGASDLSTVPLLGGKIQMLSDGSVSYLSVFGLNRETAAGLFLSGAGLALLQWFRHQKLLWRIGTVIALPLCVAGLLLQRKGVGALALAVFVALLFTALPQRLMRNSKPGLRKGVSVALALLVAVGLFVGLRFAGIRLSAAAPAVSSEETAPEAVPTEEESAAPETPPSQAVSEDAAPTEAPSEETAPVADSTAEAPTESETEAAEGASQSSAPTPAAQEAAPAAAAGAAVEVPDGIAPSDLLALVQAQPLTVLLGAGETDMVMDNLFLQQFVASGLPGLLIYAALLLSLFWRGLGCCFSDNEDVTMTMRATAGLLLGLFGVGMVQALLSAQQPFLSFLFALLAGRLMQACDNANVPGFRLALPRRMRRGSYRAQRLTNEEQAAPVQPEEEAYEPEVYGDEEAGVPAWMLQKTPEVDLSSFAGVGEDEEEDQPVGLPQHDGEDLPEEEPAEDETPVPEAELETEPEEALEETPEETPEVVPEVESAPVEDAVEETAEEEPEAETPAGVAPVPEVPVEAPTAEEPSDEPSDERPENW